MIIIEWNFRCPSNEPDYEYPPSPYFNDGFCSGPQCIRCGISLNVDDDDLCKRCVLESIEGGIKNAVAKKN